MWIIFALLVPTLNAIVIMLDKLIVDRYATGPFSYSFGVGVCGILIVAIMAPIVMLTQGISLESITGGFVTGAVTTTGLLFFLIALRQGQASRVAPIHALSPLIVAPLAVLMLGEHLSGFSVIAILLAVFGAIFVSWHGNSAKGNFGDPRTITLALISAVFMALTFILTKYFVERLDFWQFYVAFRLGFALTLLATIVMPEVHRSLYQMARNRGFMGYIFLNVGIIVSISFVVRFLAIRAGPVSLVSAIGSISPGMVFIYSILLANIWPSKFSHWVTRSTMVPQVIGIIFIATGVSVISIMQ